MTRKFLFHSIKELQVKRKWLNQKKPCRNVALTLLQHLNKLIHIRKETPGSKFSVSLVLLNYLLAKRLTTFFSPRSDPRLHPSTLKLLPCMVPLLIGMHLVQTLDQHLPKTLPTRHLTIHILAEGSPPPTHVPCVKIYILDAHVKLRPSEQFQKRPSQVHEALPDKVGARNSWSWTWLGRQPLASSKTRGCNYARLFKSAWMIQSTSFCLRL